jgi:hypothetical protein
MNGYERLDSDGSYMVSIRATEPVDVYSTYQASGNDDAHLATLRPGETYQLDYMLSYFGNWRVEVQNG